MEKPSPEVRYAPKQNYTSLLCTPNAYPVHSQVITMLGARGVVTLSLLDGKSDDRYFVNILVNRDGTLSKSETEVHCRSKCALSNAVMAPLVHT